MPSAIWNESLDSFLHSSRQMMAHCIWVLILPVFFKIAVAFTTVVVVLQLAFLRRMMYSQLHIFGDFRQCREQTEMKKMNDREGSQRSAYNNESYLLIVNGHRHCEGDLLFYAETLFGWCLILQIYSTFDCFLPFTVINKHGKTTILSVFKF